jgi:dTMP kinase
MPKTKKLPGHFITLEGGEGSGKSSLLQKVSDVLTARGYEVVTTREPGGSVLGNQIRQWLLESKADRPVSHLAELFLFLAARAQHVEELIQPALTAGKIVICDRFNDSTLAYQGVARALDIKMVKKLCQVVCQTVQPELTLFLNVDPHIGLNRSKGVHKEESGQGTLDRIESEKLDFHIKVQQAFKTIAAKEPLRVYTINANQSQEIVLKEALRAIEELVLLPHSKNG